MGSASHCHWGQRTPTGKHTPVPTASPRRENWDFGAHFLQSSYLTHTRSYFYAEFALHTHNQVRALKPQEPKQTGPGDITEKAQTEEGRAGGKGSNRRERFKSFSPALIHLTAWNKIFCGYDSLPSLMLNSQSKTSHLWLPFRAGSSCSWRHVGTRLEKKIPIQTRAPQLIHGHFHPGV